MALGTLALSALACGGGAGGGRRGPEDFTNPFLGAAHSQWLVGPLGRIATPAERQQFLALRDDQAAEQFIEAFWQRRDPAPAEPGNPMRDRFDQRAAEADRRFSEAGYSGRRTDRGTILVIYGEPKTITFELTRHPEPKPIEVWTYEPEAAAPSLDGRPPAARYRFAKRGDFTVFFSTPGFGHEPVTPRF